MIAANQKEIISSLTDLLRKLEESLIRTEGYQRTADSPGEKARWSSESTYRQAEILMCKDLIARVQG
jgi:hypothetical protein